MTRSTIDYGIDLGTTNSAVAVLDGTDTRVIANAEGAQFTPSAVWVDKRGQMHVGRAARQRIESDPENGSMEFKLQMGLGEKAAKTFQATGRTMSPEQLSAEVLKSLRADVQQSCNEQIHAAVITVPAAFELPQCEATRAAAELAGLQSAPLLQEPVAAALAYGFQSASEKVFWLVYDFGGGTFDAAIIQVRDGAIQVVNHAGDNYLGGKLIDWDLVTARLAPACTEQYNLPDFQPANAKYKAAFAKLKHAAEEAKIHICRTDQPYSLFVENVCTDADGKTVDLDMQLTPADLAEVAGPYVKRSIHLCRKALEEKSLAPGDIEKAIMVGGTTLMPALRHQVAEELGIELEFSIDPITAVARGAAVFAGTQKLEVEIPAEQAAGKFRFEVSEAYEPVGSDPNPPLGGRIVHPDGGDLAGYSIELVETRSQWRSGQIPLGPEGVFITDLHAEPGRKCQYTLELKDPSGQIQQLVPDTVTYTMGLVMESPPLIHSVGVAMANNQVDVFLAKGTPLPGQQRSVHRTAKAATKSDTGDVLCIPVVEGENTMRADRNRLIGQLRIGADQLKRDLPESSEIEITICIDASRLVTTRAYIPLFDEEYEAQLTLEMAVADVGQLRQEFCQAQTRLNELRAKASAAGIEQAAKAVSRIDGEQMEKQVSDLLDAAQSDSDKAGQAQARLLDLHSAIDEVEDALELPELIREANEAADSFRPAVENLGNESEKAQYKQIEAQLSQAIAAGKAQEIRRCQQGLVQLSLSIQSRQPAFWVQLFGQLVGSVGQMTDPMAAQQLIARGQQAMNANNIDELQAVVRQLISMLPAEKQAQVMGHGGTTVR
jgi:molecular chaperone DnaK